MKAHDLMHLAAAMAHEVRNPLNSMAIHVELLETRLGKPEPLDRDACARSARVIGGEIERIDHILEEFLAYAGPAEGARDPIDPAKLVTDVMTRVRQAAEARGVGLERRV